MQTRTQSDTPELTDYDEAILLHPNSAEAYFNRGKARALLDGSSELSVVMSLAIGMPQ